MLTTLWLGQRPYAPTLELQRRLHEERKRGARGDLLLLLEHEPTITLGRGAHAEHLLAGEAELARLGVRVHPTDRGGDITLHAPGQLVAYPIVGLPEGRRDVRRYVQGLEEVMRRLVATFGIAAGSLPRFVGLWADAAAPTSWAGAGSAPVKLGAIGVRISRWTTMHGFALNLTTDLSLFRLIVPCGIAEHDVSSVAALTGRRPRAVDLVDQTRRELCSVLDLEPGPRHDLAAPGSIDRWLAATGDHPA